MADQPDLLAPLQASVDRAIAGRQPVPGGEFDGGAEEDSPFTPTVGQPVVIEIGAWLDEDGYYTWDGEGGIRAGEVLSVRPADWDEP